MNEKQLIKLTERIYYMPHNEETDRPILGYVKGDKFSLMIDSGNSNKHVELFIDEVSAMEMPYPKHREKRWIRFCGNKTSCHIGGMFFLICGEFLVKHHCI